jgi:hypothetical protein
MATVINTPGTATSNDGAAAGWAVAAVVLLAALLVALFVWPGWVRPAATQNTVPGTNINVSLPDVSVPGTGGSGTEGTGGGTGGASQPSGSGQTAPAQ